MSKQVFSADLTAPSTAHQTLHIERNMEEHAAGRSEIVVTDIQMPFMSMVTFMVKWVLASIPAFIILALLTAILVGMFAGLFAGLTGR